MSGNCASETQPVDSRPAQVDSSPVQVDLSDMVRLVDRLSRENQQLAGQLGFLQSELQQRDRQIALLTAPKDDEPEQPTQPDPTVSWWRRLLAQ